MKMKCFAMLAALLFPMAAMAADGDMHGSMSDHDMSGMHHDMGNKMSGDIPMNGTSQDMFLKKAEVDGYTVSFHVMQNAGRSNGGTHDMMVKVEKDDKPVVIVKANSKVITSDPRRNEKNEASW